MSTNATHELQMLDELAEFGMVVVRRLSSAIEASETNADLVALTNAFCQAGRGVRQSIALCLRIKSGTFPGERPAERTAEAVEVDRPERDPVERCDWNEYERPDWETPERLDAGEHFETDFEAGVIRIRRDYAKAIAALPPQDRPTLRAGLMTGSAALRLVDSS